MINNSISNYEIPLLIKERLIIIGTHDNIFINTYFKCKNTPNEYKDILFELFADTSNIIDVIFILFFIYPGCKSPENLIKRCY